MDNIQTTENEEAGIVLIGAVGSAISGFILAAPLPVEWKAPITGLALAISGGILLYWKQKVNKPMAVTPVA